MKKSPIAAPAAPEFAKFDLASLASLSGDSIKTLAIAEFAALDSFTNSRLPYIGAIRFHAQRNGLSLAEIVKEYGTGTRKAFEDSKSFADVLSAISAFIPQASYEAISRAESRTLADYFSSIKKDTATLEKLTKYLSGPCKFRAGWIAYILEKFPAATDAPAATAPAATDAPAATLSAIALVELVKGHLSRMNDKQAEAARSMLAALCNSPEKLKALLSPAANIAPFKQAA